MARATQVIIAGKQAASKVARVNTKPVQTVTITCKAKVEMVIIITEVIMDRVPRIDIRPGATAIRDIMVTSQGDITKARSRVGVIRITRVTKMVIIAQVTTSKVTITRATSEAKMAMAIIHKEATGEIEMANGRVTKVTKTERVKG